MSELLRRPEGVPIFYLVALAAAEVVTVFAEPGVGLLLHGILLIALIAHASLSAPNSRQKLLLTLTLAPLTRILSLTVPLPKFPLVFWYALVGAPLLLAAAFTARSAGFTRADVGLTTRKLPVQLLIAFSGIGLGYIEYLILRPAALIAVLSWEQLLLPALILLVFTGFLEELIFRGLMQCASLDMFGPRGLIYGALIFAILHLGYHSALDVLFVFSVALIFGAAVRRTGSILGVTLSHGLTNIGLFLIYPFLVR